MPNTDLNFHDRRCVYRALQDVTHNLHKTLDFDISFPSIGSYNVWRTQITVESYPLPHVRGRHALPRVQQTLWRESTIVRELVARCLIPSMAMVGVVSRSLYRRPHSLSRMAWSWVGGRLAPFYIHQWTRWTLAMALPWWQHHKHCRAYYIIIIIIITTDPYRGCKTKQKLCCCASVERFPIL